MCSISLRFQRDLQRHSHSAVTCDLTTDWAPLAGGLRFRCVATQAEGVAEEAVSVEGVGMTVFLAVVPRRSGRSSICGRCRTACTPGN